MVIAQKSKADVPVQKLHCDVVAVAAVVIADIAITTSDSIAGINLSSQEAAGIMKYEQTKPRRTSHGYRVIGGLRSKIASVFSRYIEFKHKQLEYLIICNVN